MIERHVDGDLAQKLSLSIEHLDSPITAIRHVDISLSVERNAMRSIELPGFASRFTPGFEPFTIFADLFIVPRSWVRAMTQLNLAPSRLPQLIRRFRVSLPGLEVPVAEWIMRNVGASRIHDVPIQVTRKVHQLAAILLRRCQAEEIAKTPLPCASRIRTEY